jgi:hypothetical protein
MMMKRLLFVALLAASALLVGCGPQWRVMTQAAPDPFLNQTKFAVLPVAYEGLMVGGKTEPQYLSEKDADTQQKWVGDKTGMNEEFTKALISQAHDAGVVVVPATGPDAAPYMIRAHISFIEPGFYAYVANSPSQVQMTVQITTPDGKVLDEIALKHGTTSGMLNPSTGQRLRSDAEALGNITGAYLKSRVHPE